MTASWRVHIYDNQQLAWSVVVSGPVELGRQWNEAEEPYSQKRLPDGSVRRLADGASKRLPDGTHRVVVARLNEDSVSRSHALVEALPDDRVRVTNLSTRRPIRLPDNSELDQSSSCELSLPVLLILGGKTVRLEMDADDLPLQGLVEATASPAQFSVVASRFPTLAPSGGVDTEALIRWLQTTMGVLHGAATSREFFPRAAQALVDVVGLDSGRVLVLNEGEWKEESSRTALHVAAELKWQPSRRILERVHREKRTFWQAPGPTAAHSLSLAGVKVVVAAPILNRQEEVIGALYGDRRHQLGSACAPISRLDAMLVDLLASGVAAGLARLEQEKEALAAHVRLEQFVTKELAREMVENPEYLKGRDLEVTVLFCDIRGFSRVSERLDPQVTVEWINAVMGALSDCVLAQGGVLVDYIGDELMAMWGAPKAQADQSARACRAALAMLEQLPQLNERWQSILGEPMDLGVGLNTGVARVGNTGSERKLKYGPLGNTVNLASRVQGATKYLKCRLLITGATQAQLGADFATRRLCRVRVRNISAPVELYELAPPGRPDWSEVKEQYEQALKEFEKQNFRLAARMLGPLVSQPINDGPSLVLMSRAVNALVEEAEEFDPVWELPGK